MGKPSGSFFRVAMAFGLPASLGGAALTVIAALSLFTPLAEASEEQADAYIQRLETALLPVDEQPAPAKSVTEWRAQIAASLTQVTNVRLEPEDGTIRLILETASGTLSLPTPTAVGNQLTALIPNAVLALPEGASFIQDYPIDGIAQVSVTEAVGDQVQVVITGVDAAPTATVNNEAQTLVFAVTAETIAAEPAEDDELEITVTAEQAIEGFFVPEASTATRTDTPLRDTPQSVQVIPREILDSQQVVRLDEALQNLSGVVSGGRDLGRQLVFSLRGFQRTFRRLVESFEE